jgi:hypothetical protein
VNRFGGTGAGLVSTRFELAEPFVVAGANQALEKMDPRRFGGACNRLWIASTCRTSTATLKAAV